MFSNRLSNRGQPCLCASAAGCLLVVLGPACSHAPEKAAPKAGQAGSMYRDGRVYVGGAPSPAQLDELRRQGVSTVIDLRRPEEGIAPEAQAAKKLGLKYISIPMSSDGLTPATARAFLDAMKTSGDEPILIHCSAGNRAGAMYGLYLGAMRNCDEDESIRRAREAGLRRPELERALRSRLRGGSKAD